jgi:hypothetical protein
MNEINHEGKTYILKSDVENIIKDRISKVASRAQGYETQISELKEQLETASKSQGTIDILTNQVNELQSQLTGANQKYTRFQAASKHGFNNEDMLEALEYSYEKAMKKLPKKSHVPLSEWLDNCVQNPEQAPVLIRPHLPTAHPPAQTQPQGEAPQAHAQTTPTEQPQTQPPPIPRMNSGTIPTPEQGDIIGRAMKDQNFYAQNRDAIKAAWNKGGWRR